MTSIIALWLHSNVPLQLQSLQGKWNDQYIFVIKQQLEQYRFCEKQISELDAQIVKLINQRMKKMQLEKPELKNYQPQLKKQLQPNDIKLEASPVLYKHSKRHCPLASSALFEII